MSYYTYILYSIHKNKYYVGSTENVLKRLTEHNKVESISTKTGKPWQLIAVVEKDTRNEAMKLESRIKKRGIKRFLLDNEINV
jgi:putative endonuclease